MSRARVGRGAAGDAFPGAEQRFLPSESRFSAGAKPLIACAILPHRQSLHYKSLIP